MSRDGWITPEHFAAKQTRSMVPSRGRLLVASCRSGSYLAKRVVDRYQRLLHEQGSRSDVDYLEQVDWQFSDGETCARLERHVGGCDVFLFQALYDPTSERSVDQNYMAFLISARAFREHGANHVTAVLPYLAYGRQDKPTRFMREPTTAKLMADLSIAAGVDWLVTWHPHSGQARGFYGDIPLDILDGLALFMEEYQRYRGREDVVAVAPDAGASKLVTYFGRALDLKSAIASKYRPKPGVVEIAEVIGDLESKQAAIILDDMVSSGETVRAIVKKLVEEEEIDRVHLGVSHNLCTESALRCFEELHADYGLAKVVVTDSIPQTNAFQALPFVSVRSLAEPLARVINRIHYNRSVSELFRDP
jgi:ribose-phosphate pyrophosphokinase